MRSQGLRLAYLAATGDVHSPKFLSLLSKALNGWTGSEPCLVLLAGDLVYKGQLHGLQPLVRMIKERFPRSRIVAVFGNEDYEDIRERMKSGFREILWLDDDFSVFECKQGDREMPVAVVGTQGALDKLTPWQKKHKPQLEKVFRERPVLVERLIMEARKHSSRVVLLSHYALSKATILGEDPRIHPYLYSRLMERVVVKSRPDAAIHGHAHKGRPYAVVGGVAVYNVALPLNKRIVEVPLRPGIEEFFK